jgi:hypothetical protein
MGMRRVAALRQIRVPTLAKWLIPAFAIGLVLGGLILSGEDSVAEPQEISAADLSIPIQPPEGTSGSSGPALPSASPGDEPAAGAVESPRVIPTSAGVVAKPSPSPRRPRARDVVASRSASKPAGTAAQSNSTAAKLPRYRGSLAIESTPPGATVSVDGRVVGSAPVLLEEVPAGSCVVRVESSGYELWSAAVHVVANKRTRVTAMLQAGSKP